MQASQFMLLTEILSENLGPELEASLLEVADAEACGFSTREMCSVLVNDEYHDLW